jgi:hypothetical protein
MQARQAFIFSVSLLSVYFLAGAALVHAVPQPNGAEFKVSTCDACKKRTPAVAGARAGATAGAFLVAWESTTPADPLGISGRFFAKTGNPRTADVLVNRDTFPAQQDVAAASDTPGNFVVAWSVRNGSNSDVMVQRYKASGLVNGAAILVNVDTPGAPAPAVDVEPAVATTADGGFIVAWIRSVPPTSTTSGETPAVMLRRYSNAGVPSGQPLKISSGLVLGQRPDACIDSTGRAVVAWTSVDEFNPFEPNRKGASVRRVAANGTPVGSELVVAPPTSSESDVGVACGAGGTFLVLWSTDQAPAADGMDIVAQRYTTLARRNGATFRINSVTAGQQTSPALSSDAAGNFVVVWESSVSGSIADAIVGRRFLASATADGADFVVHTRATAIEERPITPDVGNLGAVGFVIVWAQGNSGLQGRRYRLTP